MNIDIENFEEKGFAEIKDFISNMVFIEEFKLRFFKFIKAEGVLSIYNIKNPAIRASLMFFLPNEDVFNNLVHQDIYAYTSEKFLKFFFRVNIDV